MDENADRKFERWRRTGDAGALADVFDEIAPQLLRLAIHLVGDVAAAEDLVQSTFVVAIESAQAWDASRPLEPWLTGILDHRARKLLRARRRPLDDAAREDVERDTPLAHAIASESSGEVAKALDQLEEPYRSVLVLSVMHGMEPAAIAHALARSPGVVRVQLHRGREMLKKSLPAGVLASATIAIGSARGMAAIKAAVLSRSGKVAASAAAMRAGSFAVLTKLALAVVSVVVLAGGTALVAHSIAARTAAPEVGTGAVFESKASPVSASLSPASRSAAAREPATGSTYSFTVAGRVVNLPYPGVALVESPAVGAEIRLTVITDEGPPVTKEMATRTDEHGAFRFAIDKPRSKSPRIDVDCPSDTVYRDCGDTRTLDASVTSLEDVVLKRAAHGTLHGVTLDDHEAPLKGVRVTVAPSTLGQGQEVQATSDEHGSFELAPKFDSPASVRAELDGWSLFESVALIPRAAGGWSDTTLVLAPAGKLVVHALDSRGAPIASLPIHVQPAHDEPRRMRMAEYDGPRFDVRTDAQGAASFDHLWRGVRLSVRVGERLRSSAGEWMRAGKLLYGLRDSAEPVIIGDKGVLELLAQDAPELVLHGHVIAADRSPAANAIIEVREANASPLFDRDALFVNGRADAQGRFRLEVPRRGELANLCIAVRTRAKEIPYRPSESDKLLTGAGSLIVDPYSSDSERELEIRLEPLLAIMGSVRDETGAPAKGSIRAVPAGSPWEFTLSHTGRPIVTSVAADGSFRLDNLPPGNFDLFFDQQGSGVHTRAAAMYVLRDVEAGAKEVAFVVAREMPVHVHVRASSSSDVVHMTVLHSARLQRTRDPVRARIAPAHISVDSISSWPLGAPLDITGGSGQWDPDQYDGFLFDGCDAGACDLVMGECTGLIGVVATLADGRECFPSATQLMSWNAGEHEVDFTVVPVTILEGRIRSSDSLDGMEVALADAEGALLPLRGVDPDPMAHLVRSIVVRDDGRFRIEAAPVGKVRLRVGAHEQLERGQFVLERTLDVVDNGPPFEIDMSK